MSIHMSVHMSTHISIHMYIHMSIHMSMHMVIHVSKRISSCSPTAYVPWFMVIGGNQVIRSFRVLPHWQSDCSGDGKKLQYAAIYHTISTWAAVATKYCFCSTSFTVAALDETLIGRTLQTVDSRL